MQQVPLCNVRVSSGVSFSLKKWEYMSLVTTIEALQKRPLTAEEVSTLNEFQQSFKIDDDDPLLVVLALMARSQIIVDAVPNLLQQKVTETIELHRLVLRDQAVMIAKELIATLAEDIGKAALKNQRRWIQCIACFIGGMVFYASITGWIGHFAR